ncbi:MAG: hypothetical protein FJ298_10620 [Planctomycetes bacterium]|nr:hypothetical protein [Planctomycetota bacterium]
MNKNAKIALYSAGGVGGFAAAYVLFALMMGAPAYTIPVIGGLFPSPAENGEEAVVDSPLVANETHSETRTERREASAGLMDVFQIQSPYSGAELEALATELKRKVADLDTRLATVAEREKSASARAEQLDEHYAELQRLQRALEEREKTLADRESSVTESDRARTEREQQGWARLGKLFAEGDAAELGPRLAEYAPLDAARILHAQKPTRAKELLENVGATKWREYADAYRTLDPARDK